MMKRSFDRKLFGEAVRELKTAGLIFLTAYILISGFPLLVKGMRALSSGDNTPQFMTPQELLPIGLLCFLVIAPFLVFKVFHFTVKRSSSDFYFALPHSRLSLFFSFFAAAFCWLALILLAGSLLAGGIASFFPGAYSFRWDGLLEYTAVLLTMSLYVMAVTALAVSWGGTLLSQILLMVLLLFGPRLAVYVLSQSVVDSRSYLIRGYLPWPFNQINLLTRFSFHTLDGGSNFLIGYEEAGTGAGFWLPLLYTLGASLLWLAFSAFCFIRRRSETAESAFVSARVRAFFCISLAFLLSLISLDQLYRVSTGSSDFSADALGWLILALPVLFGAEWILTKHIGSVRKALPSAGILLLLWVLSFGAMKGGEALAEGYQPKADELQYVRLMAGTSNGNEYFWDQAASVRLSDQKTREIMALALENAKNTRVYYSGYSRITVAYKSGLQERYRRVLLSQTQRQLLEEALAENEDFQRIWLNLPDAADMSVPAVYFLDDYSPRNVSSADRQKLYESLRQEVGELGFKAWFSLLNDPWQQGEGFIFTIHVENGSAGSYYQMLPVTPALPRTYALGRALLAHQQNQEQASLLSALERLLETEETEASASLYLLARLPGGEILLEKDYSYGSLTVMQADGSRAPALSRGQLQDLRSLLGQESLWKEASPALFSLEVTLTISAPARGSEYCYAVFFSENLPSAIAQLLAE